LTSAPLSAA